MERDNKNTENRKRTRGDEEDGKKECHVSKKQETDINDHISSYNRENEECDRFCDTIFDFPWLKDVSVFETNEFFEHDRDMFAPSNYSYVDIVQDTLVNTGDDRCCQEKEFEGDGLSSFQDNDFEALDCVWNSVIDQPIDTKT